MKNRHKSSGFTLIELVVVIVILGILAAVALPRFVDLSSDAEKASVESTVGALSSARALWMAKAVVCGVPYGDATTTFFTFVDLTGGRNRTPACQAGGGVTGESFDSNQIRNGLMAAPKDANILTNNQLSFVTKSGRHGDCYASAGNWSTFLGRCADLLSQIGVVSNPVLISLESVLKNGHKSAGFTLIELVVVIVILGILAAVALPRFVDLSSDAEKAAVEGTVGGLASARALWLSKAVVCGTDYASPGRLALADVVGLSASPQAAVCNPGNTPPYTIMGHAFDANQIRNGLMSNPAADLFVDNPNNGNVMSFVTKSGRTVTITHTPASGALSWAAAPSY